MEHAADGAMDGDTQHAPSITLALMPQQQGEVRTAADDWTGIVDRNERRRLQNRLNQRAYRKRETKKKVKRPKVEKDDDSAKVLKDTEISPTDTLRSTALAPDVNDSESPTSESTNARSNSEDSNRSGSQGQVIPRPAAQRTLCSMTPEEMFNLVAKFEDWAHQAYLMGQPDVDNLLSLIHFNVFRGLLGNANVLGFNSSWFADEEAISPFLGHPQKVPSDYDRAPNNLQPTRLQRTVEHHPWIDLFPLPRFRDNILEQGPDFDDEPLCIDVVEFAQSGYNKGTGLVVWGDPWDPYSWEVSEDFARNWPWIIRGCRELFESTNRWRAKRGERPLFAKEDVSNASRVEEYNDY